MTDPMFSYPRPGELVSESGFYQMVSRRGTPIGAPFRHRGGSRMPPTPEKGCRWVYAGPLPPALPFL